MFEHTNVNLSALLAELRAHALESQSLKRQLRRPWTEPMAEVQRALCRCRRRTTELCILRALLRGRHHLRRPLREGTTPGSPWDAAVYHRRVAERVVAELALAVAS